MSYTPLKPDGALPIAYRGVGLGQTYRTEGCLDLDAYETSELGYTAAEGRFPLVVSLAAGGPSAPAKSAVSSQTTFAALRLDAAGGDPAVQVLKQKIVVDGTPYELQEIYGIDGATSSEGGAEAGGADEPAGDARDCVICMTEARDTTVLPCRHMCMCYDCAKVLRMQSEKCPICRTPIESLLQIKISSKEGANSS